LDTLPNVKHLIDQGIEAGEHLGAQIYLSRDGNVVADAAFGEVRPGVAMTPDSIQTWMSATKPIAAVAFAQQWELGNLDLDRPVAEVIPTFEQGGKETITPRHLLTHTAGFRASRFKSPGVPWDEIITAICATPLEPDWIPGERAGYHLHSSWFILGELVRIASGKSPSDYYRQHIFEPLGMVDSWIGMPADYYREHANQIGQMPRTTNGTTLPSGFDQDRWCTDCRPGGSGYGPTRELGRFYEMLLNRGELNGTRIIDPETVDLFTDRHRVGMHDRSFKHIIDWGLGFIPNSAKYGVDTVPYGYGPHASDQAFGHSGYQSSVAFADPPHKLAVAIVFNGMPGEAAHHKRNNAILDALYTDLGLV
jgi:CubicO group peptidase (beta-lactamase class C family)